MLSFCRLEKKQTQTTFFSLAKKYFFCSFFEFVCLFFPFFSKAGQISASRLSTHFISHQNAGNITTIDNIAKARIIWTKVIFSTNQKPESNF